MRVAVSATGPSLEAAVDPHFGRCACFVLVETDDLSFEVVRNEAAALGGGAGIQAGQMMAHKGVAAVLTGSCGPNAHETLAAAGIAVMAGCSGTVAEVVARLKAGELRAAGGPTSGEHAGLASGHR
jgi:predicted Fe-Mo cluster-binding NifX family protein